MSSRSVLVVAPEFSDFAALAADLTLSGISPQRARTLEECLQRQRQAPAEAVICDADSLDWRVALDALLQAGKAPVIFLTRRADERLWVQMLQAGAFDVMTKPYRIEELRWVVTSALGWPGGWSSVVSA